MRFVIASQAWQSKNVDQSAVVICIQALWRVSEPLDVHAGCAGLRDPAMPARPSQPKAQWFATAARRLRLARIQAEFRPVRIMMGHKKVQTMAHNTRLPKVEPP